MPTAQQRRQALERANAVRQANHRLKQWIAADGPHQGARRAAEAIELAQSSTRFDELLRAVPGVGPSVCRQMLSRAQINGALRVNAYGIAEARRRELVLVLKAWADGYGRRR